MLLHVIAYVCWLGGGGKSQSKAFVDDIFIVIMHSPPVTHTHITTTSRSGRDLTINALLKYENVPSLPQIII